MVMYVKEVLAANEGLLNSGMAESPWVVDRPARAAGRGHNAGVVRYALCADARSRTARFIALLTANPVPAAYAPQRTVAAWVSRLRNLRTSAASAGARRCLAAMTWVMTAP